MKGMLHIEAISYSTISMLPCAVQTVPCSLEFDHFGSAAKVCFQFNYEPPRSAFGSTMSCQGVRHQIRLYTMCTQCTL